MSAAPSKGTIGEPRKGTLMCHLERRYGTSTTTVPGTKIVKVTVPRIARVSRLSEASCRPDGTAILSIGQLIQRRIRKPKRNHSIAQPGHGGTRLAGCQTGDRARARAITPDEVRRLWCIGRTPLSWKAAFRKPLHHEKPFSTGYHFS